MAYSHNLRPRSSGHRRFSRPGVQSFGASTQRRRPAKRGAYISPDKFIKRAIAATEQPPYQATHAFTDFAFAAALQHNVTHKKYSTPTAIQDQAIPLILDGQDVIGLANTGTGKTAAFLLPIIERLYANRVLESVLILAPTRELAQQIDEEFRAFAWNLRLYSTVCVGGANILSQIRGLRRRPHVIIGTPGRLKDLLNRGELKLGAVNMLVLDEADRMLDMGFINDIRTIVAETPAQRQTLFFSATMTPSIQQLTQSFLRDPHTVSVRTADTSDNIDQDVIEAATKEDKLRILTELLQDNEFEKVLLFGETKFGVQRLSDHLEKSGFAAAAIHGNKSQSQRQRALKAFKDNQVRILVATDVAARGLDIPNVSHVINFDQPATYEDYVHRIGRTGRAGATGKALTFVTQRP